MTDHPETAAKGMSFADFTAKIEWEGGVIDALDYGLKHTHLIGDDEATRELRSTWAELEQRYAACRPLIDRIDELMEAFDE